MAFRERGTKATWANPGRGDPPDSQKQNGGWYYNPATGSVDRWWTDGGGGGGGNQQQQSVPQPPSAEEILRRAAEERNRKYQEQAKIWNEFMGSPTFWDAVLARQASEAHQNPYWAKVLEDFVKPLQTRIRQSTETEARLLSELGRMREVGTQERKQELMENIEKAQSGFAGAGTYGGGGARRALAREKIGAQRELEDFLGTNEAQAKKTSEEQDQQEELYQGDIDIKTGQVNRDKTAAIEQDVAEQRTDAYKKRSAEAYNKISSQFGEFMLNVPDWLQY